MRNLRNFGITFAVSLVVLGLVALFACGFVADTVCGIFDGSNKGLDEILASGETTSPSADTDDERFSRKINGDSFTWLMVVADYRPEVFDNYYPSSEKAIDSMKDFGALGAKYQFITASDIVVIRADVETREYIVMSIPSCTKAETPAGDYTLAEIYAYYGADYFTQKIGAMTGLTIDYYSVLYSSDLSSLANTIGTVQCTIPVEIYTDGKNYFSAPETTDTAAADTTAKNSKDTTAADTTKKAEETTVIESALEKADSVALAGKLEAALLYNDMTDGVGDEMTVLQSFADGVMKNLSDSSSGSLQSMFTAIKGKLCATNISADAVAAEAEVIQAYSWFEVQTLTYPGNFVSAKGTIAAYYNPIIGEAVSFFEPYR